MKKTPDFRIELSEDMGPQHQQELLAGRLADQFGSLPVKLSAMLSDAAHDMYGESAISNHSDVRLIPTTDFEEPLFMISGWHSTADGDGVFQRVTLGAKLARTAEGPFLKSIDTERAYALSDSEFQELEDLGALATLQTLHSLLSLDTAT